MEIFAGALGSLESESLDLLSTCPSHAREEPHLARISPSTCDPHARTDLNSPSTCTRIRPRDPRNPTILSIYEHQRAALCTAAPPSLKILDPCRPRKRKRFRPPADPATARGTPPGARAPPTAPRARARTHQPSLAPSPPALHASCSLLVSLLAWHDVARSARNVGAGSCCTSTQFPSWRPCKPTRTERKALRQRQVCALNSAHVPC